MRRLLIFLKEPTPGQVKTRLATIVGDEASSALYRACIELALERLAGFRRESVVCVDPPEAVARLRASLGPGWAYEPQRGAHLGERLADATARAFDGGASQVVIIGTDSPWVHAEDITAAFKALARADVVLGPTDDGGYYLIGLSRRTPALFQGIAWSSPSVFADTHTKARALGLRVETLRAGYDLDHLADVQRFIEDEYRKGQVPHAVQTIEALSQRRAAC